MRCNDQLASPGSASATQQGTRAAQLGKSEFPRPAGCSQLLAQKRSHALLACLIAMVVYLFVHPDVEFGPVLVSNWICCHSYSGNRTTDLCLLLYCCLEIKSRITQNYTDYIQNYSIILYSMLFDLSCSLQLF